MRAFKKSNIGLIKWDFDGYVFTSTVTLIIKLTKTKKNQKYRTWSLLLPFILFTVCIILILISTCFTGTRMSVWKTVSQAQFPKLLQLKLHTDVSKQAPIWHKKKASDRGKDTLWFIENVSTKGSTIFVYKPYTFINLMFYIRNCNPWRRSSSSFPATPVKIEIVSLRPHLEVQPSFTEKGFILW